MTFSQLMLNLASQGLGKQSVQQYHTNTKQIMQSIIIINTNNRRSTPLSSSLYQLKLSSPPPSKTITSPSSPLSRTTSFRMSRSNVCPFEVLSLYLLVSPSSERSKSTTTARFHLSRG